MNVGTSEGFVFEDLVIQLLSLQSSSKHQTIQENLGSIPPCVMEKTLVCSFFTPSHRISRNLWAQTWATEGYPLFRKWGNTSNSWPFHIMGIYIHIYIYIHDELVELGNSHCLRTKPLNGRECESMSPDLPGCGSDWSCWPIFWIQSSCCRDEGPGGGWEAVDDLIVVDIVDTCLLGSHCTS